MDSAKPAPTAFYSSLRKDMRGNWRAQAIFQLDNPTRRLTVYTCKVDNGHLQTVAKVETINGCTARHRVYRDFYGCLADSTVRVTEKAVAAQQASVDIPALIAKITAFYAEQDAVIARLPPSQ